MPNPISYRDHYLGVRVDNRPAFNASRGLGFWLWWRT
jgi:hypothetical protein